MQASVLGVTFFSSFLKSRALNDPLFQCHFLSAEASRSRTLGLLMFFRKEKFINESHLLEEREVLIDGVRQRPDAGRRGVEKESHQHNRISS